MATEHRKNLGFVAGEEFVETDPDADGSCSRLFLPAPVLQTEIPENQRPVKFYFAVHMMIAAPTGTTDYFLVHGDHIGEMVFICAIYEDTCSLPNVFLCLEENAFMNWLQPPQGRESLLPPSNGWELCNSVEFCRSYIRFEDPKGLKGQFTDPALFASVMLDVITELFKFRSSEEYKMAFKILFNVEKSVTQSRGGVVIEEKTTSTKSKKNSCFTYPSRPSRTRKVFVTKSQYECTS
jgi:hypothetical protein